MPRSNDDRPQVTIAGARAGKTSTVLEPNLYLYPGLMVVLDPKGELSRTARFRRALWRVFAWTAATGFAGWLARCVRGRTLFRGARAAYR
jgi:type IV secretory pathway TraG/TraD family ATPase VirD4